MTSRGAEKMKNITIGVDVSKDHLDAHRLADSATQRFANHEEVLALIKWLTETRIPGRVRTDRAPIIAPSGMGIAGVPFVKVNPRQARRFAEATGKLAKTDHLDAAIPGSHGRHAGIGGAPSPKQALARTEELHVAAKALVKDRTAAKNRGKALTLSLLKRQNAQRLEQVDRQIATVEAAILQIIRRQTLTCPILRPASIRT